MRIRNKRRRHYVKHGWKKFIDSYIDFKYEFTCSGAKWVGDQLTMDVGVKERKA